MSGLVVVDKQADWPASLPGVDVVTATEYLTEDNYTRRRGMRVYNLCRSFAYQSNGYYVSLLAGARDHRPLPEITTIQDLKLADSTRLFNDELERLIKKSLARLSSEVFELNVYFGEASSRRHQALARALFNLFPSPLLKARFSYRNKEWKLSAIAPMALGEVPESQHPFIFETAAAHFKRRHHSGRRRTPARYDLAILSNPEEKDAPSDSKALRKFEKAAKALGFSVDFLDKTDYGVVAEYDALFIRETTAVNHHTYRFSRRAAREGLVVVDDPLSILRCTNKVFLAQLLARHRIATPKTMLIHRGNIDSVGAELGFPCVLKQPDSAFSKGVVKVDDETELKQQVRELLERSDLIVGQAFEPTEYDWRIGVLDGEPLYACRYYMAPEHWQIVKRSDKTGASKWGQHETLDVSQVPPTVLDVAVRSSRAIGNGLYGVDLKQVGNRCKVIEVNDNPSLDADVEDQFLGDELYHRIMSYFLARLEARVSESRRK